MTGINFKETSKARTRFVLLLLILNSINAVAQNKTMQNMEELKIKTKQELIEIAVAILKEKQPSLIINPDDFEISVFETPQDILVDCKRKITFIPMENRITADYQYDISVMILAKCISKSYLSGVKHSKNSVEDSSFVLSDEDLKIIEIAKKESNRNDKSEQIYIVEQENDYTIIHFTDFFRSDQIIEKKTFARGLSSHKEKIPQSDSGNFKEIK